MFYSPLPRPIRLFDTREPIQNFEACEYLSQPLSGVVELTKQARIVCGSLTIPATAQVIVGNATAILPAGNGYLTM